LAVDRAEIEFDARIRERGDDGRGSADGKGSTTEEGNHGEEEGGEQEETFHEGFR
jgi:hypothetical protein